jgi:hypothetical protein
MNNGMKVTVIEITVGDAGIATVPSGIDTATRSPRVSEPAVALYEVARSVVRKAQSSARCWVQAVQRFTPTNYEIKTGDTTDAKKNRLTVRSHIAR